MRKILLILSILCFSILVKAQDLPFSGTKNKKAEYYFGEALKTFQLQDFMKAQGYLDKALALDPNFIDGYMMLAEIKKDNDKFEDAIVLYNKIVAINPDFPMSYFGRSKCYFALNKYEQAFQDATKFMTFPDYYQKKDQVSVIKNNSDFARNAILSPIPFNPVNLGNMVNSMDNEYFPGITADEQVLIFTRLVNGRDEEFYRSTRVDGKYTFAENMGYPINTERNEGTVSLSSDGQYIFYTACNRPGANGSCDLFLSKLDGNTWSEPINLGPPVNSASWESQPCLSFDGRTLYFSSNRPGGYGESDIWYTTFKNGRWTPPVNAGPEINSAGDEQSPFIAKDDQTLYFNSDGHPGMGGVDLFFTRRTPDGRWQKPINLGYPINSEKDETCLIISSNGKDAFMAKEGTDSRGGLDIYSFELYELARPKKTGYAKGVVFDAVTRKKLAAKIELIDLATGKTIIESYSNKVSGEFLVCLQGNKNYALNVSASGYLFYSENFALQNQGATDPLVISVPLQPITPGAKVVLKNIFFDSDKFDLKEESKAELNKLVQFLGANASVKIEIGGHTDNTGDLAKNNSLSANRAKAVKDYLAATGVPVTRLTYKGYADTQPIADNKTVEGRAQNRRTEIKIMP
ncbi:MAG: OmpA family protein [bacterium]|nr:OmpA family protein [bacterium]